MRYMTMKIRKIDMFLYKMYACYCDESVSYNDKQLSFKQWKEKNKSYLVKAYVKQRRKDRHGSKK